nr:MAG: hypothetical protein [Bacteriophage sp.]
MIKSVSNDEWPELAKRLPIGQKRRAFHACSRSFNKTNFEYGRDSEGVWCKCHRCGYSRHQPLNHAPFQLQEQVQVRVPDDVRPITEIITKHPRLLLPVLEREHLLPHLSVLSASEKYGRIYLPDDTASFCGLDFTGKQFIPWRSPHGHSLAMKVYGPYDDNHTLSVYGEAADYLEAVRGGGNCAFVPNVDTATIQALVSVGLAYSYQRVNIYHHPSAQRLRREMRIIGNVLIIGE